MNDANEKPTEPSDAQRQALAESEKKAAEPHPENYKEEENADKVVGVGPDLEHEPIKGMDPAPSKP